MTDKGKTKGIKTVLTSATALFFLATVFILWIGYALFMDDIYRLVKEREIKSTANTVRNMVREGTIDFESAVAAGDKYDVCIEVLKMNGNAVKRIVSADILSHCTIHNTDAKSKFAVYKEAMNNGGICLEYFRYDPDERMFYSIGKEAISADGELSMIYAVVEDDTLMLFNSTVSPISATVRTFYLFLGAFTIIVTVLVLIFSRVLSKFITKPIVCLTEAARKFGEGELDADFRVSGYTEAEELSSSIVYAANELKKTEDLRRDLLANVSHDLRTPITLITGYAEMMRDIPGENTPENLENIVSEAERLNTLVTDVLDYSKLVSGTLPFNPLRFSLTETVSEICTRYKELLKKDGFTVTFEYEGEAFVYADRDQISRVLVNFISNAISHCGDDKTVAVKQVYEGKAVKICVTDRGAGIPPSELSGIWERYYKIGKNGARTSGSSGLGLSIVKAIMERSDGAYGVTSAIGEGSVFWFLLNLAE